jgi:bacillolysin
LLYFEESGAINEAMSDILGAAVDRQEGASIENTWRIGEDIYTPFTSGDSLRNMADPQETGDYDYYPTRYMGTEDGGGVHLNSGIANLAFQLLVDGGTHPRGTTNVDVPPITSGSFDESFLEAMRIFYNANTACLTPLSNFAALRYCTAEVYGGEFRDAVNIAWDAVGVPTSPPVPPPPPIDIVAGVPITNQSGTYNAYQEYRLTGVLAGQQVACRTSGDNGDADLYISFDPRALLAECISGSYDSNEFCVTGMAPADSAARIQLHAYSAYENLTVECSIVTPPGTRACSVQLE